MNNLLTALNCVLPIFIKLSVGYVAKRLGIVTEAVVPQLNKLCFNALLSVYMFYSVYTADFDRAFSPRLIAFLVLQTLLLFAGGAVLFSRTVPDPRRRGACLQALFRSNIAIIGIALAQTLTDEAGVASMTIAITVLVPLYNTLAVIALESLRGGKPSVPHLLCCILKNSLIVGSLTGLAFSLLGIRLSSAVESAMASLGQAGTVLALVTLGISFNFSTLKQGWKQVVLLSCLRLVVIPLAVMLCAIALGFRGNDLSVTLLVSAAPMAATAFAMAQIYNSDYELTGQVVVSTSLFCCFTFFFWIFILKQRGLI